MAGLVCMAPVSSMRQFAFPLICSLCSSCLALVDFILRADGHSVQKWVCPDMTYAVDWALKTNYLSTPGEPQKMYSRHNTR